jgi:hypothetical protein
MPVSISGTNGVTFPDSSLQAAAASPYVLKNRIINGDMRIDQRNAGASVTGGVGYTFPVDRFKFYSSAASKLSGQRTTTAPTDFVNSLLLTSLAATSPAAGDEYELYHAIEGFNVADLGWGTASAQAVTLSFWVRSSLTGTFAGNIANATGSRSYVFTFTINAANTFEKKTITILGDTTGTWETGNSTGLLVIWDLGSGSTYNGTAGAWGAGFKTRTSGSVNLVGTSGATFYITGVQLEQNTSATPFERRLYNQELANCQRYFAKMGTAGTLYSAFGSCGWTGSTSASGFIKYPTTMRSSPTLAYGGVIGFSYAGGSVSNVTGVGSTYAGTDSVLWQPSGLTSATNGQAGIILANNDSTAFISFSAEL